MTKADFKILFVDDDCGYAKTWIEKAFDEFNIELVHYEDWESAYTQLNAGFDRFHAIILDAKGKITPDDSSESMTHILSALQDLKEMEGKGFIIPYVVNTGYIEDSVVRHIQKLKEIKIFSKGNESEMFNYLIDNIKTLPEYKIKKSNEEIFSIFSSDLLAPELGKVLLDTLVFAEHPSWKRVPENLFNPVRKIIESIFWKLRAINKIDERCYPGNKINLKACIDYLNGDPVNINTMRFPGIKTTPAHINNAFLYIYYTTGTFSHAYLGSETVSPYAIRSVSMALCEILYWFKSYIENLEKSKT
jgi:hypothetical protein